MIFRNKVQLPQIGPRVSTNHKRADSRRRENRSRTVENSIILLNIFRGPKFGAEGKWKQNKFRPLLSVVDVSTYDEYNSDCFGEVGGR